MNCKVLTAKTQGACYAERGEVNGLPLQRLHSIRWLLPTHKTVIVETFIMGSFNSTALLCCF